MCMMHDMSPLWDVGQAAAPQGQSDAALKVTHSTEAYHLYR